jgi:hypothetical protein
MAAQRIKGGNMKKNLLVGITAILLFCGCSTNRYLKPISTCQPLAAFNAIVITPFDGDSALVEESKYRQLPRDIAQAVTERFKDKIEFNYLFPKVVQSSECVDKAIKIEGKIYTLVHNKRSFHIGVRGRIIDCQNNKPLYLFDHDEKDSESGKLPGQIVDNLYDGIKARLTCE